MDIDKKIADLQSKINVETKCKKGAENLRLQLTEAHAIQLCESNIFESDKRLQFLETQLEKLIIKKNAGAPLSPSEPNITSAATDGPLAELPLTSMDHSESQENAVMFSVGAESSQFEDLLSSLPPESVLDDSGATSKSNRSSFFRTMSTPSSQQPTNRMSFYNFYGSLRTKTSASESNLSHSSNAPSRSGSGVFSTLFSGFTVRSRANTTQSHRESIASSLDAIPAPSILCNFDTWQTAASISSSTVTYKLREITHKLDIEQKVKAGTDRMYQAIKDNPDIDKKRIENVQEKLAECNAKVHLLQKAVQRYKSLYVEDDEETPSEPQDIVSPILKESAALGSEMSLNGTSKPKKPFTGQITIKLHSISNLTGKKTPKSEVYAVFRVDGIEKYKTKTSKIKFGETTTISVEKAQDLEICAYEKGGPIVALFWCKIADLAESLAARGKTGLSSTYASVVALNIDKPASNGNFAEGRPVDIDGRPTSPTMARASSSALDVNKMHGKEDSVEYVLEMEPSGILHCKFTLTATDRKLKKKDGVMRRNPVKKFFPKKGHKFVAMQFYQPMKCAHCSEFLLSGQGYQCQQCRYTCHKRCNSKVLIKCIATAGNEEQESSDAVEEQDTKSAHQIMKHKIPHRFVPMSNLSANWCCHCGTMLPLGKKQSLKCSECNLTCHKECQHLVPDFCGLSAQMINMMLRAIEDAERRKNEKVQLKQHLQALSAPDTTIDRQKRDSSPTIDQTPITATSSPGSPMDLSSPGNRLSLPPPPKLALDGVPAPADVPSNQKPARTSLPPEPTSKTSKMSRYIAGFSKAPRGIGLDDFNFIAVLGKGNFGKVMLAEEKYTKKHYAIKVLKKEFIIENDEVESTKTEKRVFQTANRERFPFLVNMHSCFQTESRLYFVMEYVAGGDLMWHIQRRAFSEERAKFYACEVLLALEYFHKNNIVYRDLKLDNILLTLDGHIKIADYGLCKENMWHGATTQTFCGTPEFMAPEILLEKPYTRAVDWWAFGVLIFELILGQSPFKGDDEDEIFDAILQDEIVYPSRLPKDAVSLLQKLLVKDPNKRLGSSRADAEDIKKHAYFSDIDWKAMLEGRVKPPFFPKISSDVDISNFDEEFTKEVPTLTPCNSILSPTDQEEFRGFTHVSDWAQQARAQSLAQASPQQTPNS